MAQSQHEFLVARLYALCSANGGPYVVGDRAGVNGDNLRQVLQGGKLQSGMPRSLGRRVVEKLTAAFPGWLDLPTQDAGAAASTYPMKYAATPLIVSDLLPLLPWGSIVPTSVPEVFRAVLVDDALAPDFPMGTEVVWTTRRRPTPGRIVLIADAHRQLHARQCHQGREPGHWIAAPISPAYVAFDSREPGFELVAVFKGRLEPDDPPAQT